MVKLLFLVSTIVSGTSAIGRYMLTDLITPNGATTAQLIVSQKTLMQSDSFTGNFPSRNLHLD